MTKGERSLERDESVGDDLLDAGEDVVPDSPGVALAPLFRLLSQRLTERFSTPARTIRTATLECCVPAGVMQQW